MTTDQTNGKSPKTTLARRTLLAAAVSSLCLAAAGSQGAWAQPVGGPLVSVQVIDRETGEAARVWRRDGKLYVAGQPGARYGLRVTNNTDGRIEAVMSVDGVNIITGQTAAYGQTGYVFYPHQTYDINGWRKSNDEIAAFNFAPLGGSYAAQTGRPGDVGVIGVAVFRERVAPPPPPVARELPLPRAPRGAASRVQARPPVNPPPDVAPPPPLPIPPAASRAEAAPPPLPIPPVPSRVETPAPPVVSAAPAAAKLGTGHGEREWSHVTNIDFDRATASPQYVYRLEYDSPARLIAAGVIPRPLPSPPTPRPFPGAGYVPDPPYRR